MRKFWQLGGKILILNVLCALAANPVTAFSFWYYEITDKKSQVRNQRKIQRKMYNLKFSVTWNLHDLGHPISCLLKINP